MESAVAQGGEHIVQFYGDDGELGSAVAEHLARGIRPGGAAVVIATEAHRTMFEAELGRVGVDVAEAIDRGALVLLDAAATLSRFMAGGEIAPSAFKRTIGQVLDRAAARGGPVHLYGEMVALLWDEGDVLGAIKLEELWNDLGRDRPFSLMCGYAEASVAGDPEGAEHVCCLHTSVLSSQASRRAATAGPEVERATELPLRPDAPLVARRLLAEAMAECGHTKEMLDQATLVISELVTNAVIHARTPVAVAIRSDSTRVRVAVHDFDPTAPVETERGPSTGLGMGLYLVDSLAVDWGIQPTADGKTIWAELAA